MASHESATNFLTRETSDSVFKCALTGNHTLRRHLQNEAFMMSRVQRYLPVNRVALLFSFKEEPYGSELETERLRNIGKVTLEEMLYTIEKLQLIPQEKEDQPMKTQDYWMNILHWAAYLKSAGAVFGMSESEVAWVQKKCGDLIEHIDKPGTFATVFVHTDVQKKHFGTTGEGKVVIFDFEQAHMGNELEDFAFLSVRHPEFSDSVRNYLFEKFHSSPDKLEHLSDALEFFNLYFLLKGCFDRTYRSRGKPFDHLAKIYGRSRMIERHVINKIS